VASASVLASIYNSMNARKRDIAILRALGARRRLVFGAVVVESACIGALGAFAGFVVYGVLFASVAHVIRAQTGVVLSLTEFHPVLVLAPAGLVALCALGGVVPALKAYRLPVAENLSPIS
jgi:putative ABC transport system permease protein